MLHGKIGWILRELRWVKKLIKKGYILYGSIYKTLLKWPDDKDGKQISGCQGLRTGVGEEGGHAYKRAV